MLRLTLSAIVLAAIVVAAAPSVAATTSLTVMMNAQNGSRENGKATITDESSGVKVVVTLKNAPSIDQPAHIHAGSCAIINPAPAYGLTLVKSGSSTTVVKGVTLAELLKGHYAINVHKSTDDLGTYVSCGEIKTS